MFVYLRRLCHLTGFNIYTTVCTYLPTAIIQLGDRATYDRALADDIRIFGVVLQVGNE